MPTIRNGIKFIDPPDGCSGKWSVQGGRQYTATVLAVTASPRVGPWQVLQATGLRYGTYYRWPLCSVPPSEHDFGSFLQSIDVSRDAKDGKQWKLTFEFTPYDVNHEGGASDANSFDGKLSPFDKPYDISWTSNKVERTWPYDNTTPTAKPYINAAGDPLENPPPSEDANPVVTIVRNEKKYDPKVVKLFKNKVNDGTCFASADGFFAGFDDQTLKVNDISAKRVYDPDWGVYFEVTYEFEVRPETWDVKILNAGLRSLGTTTAGTALKQIVVQGHPVANPVCLKSDGTFDPTNPPAPNYLTFKQYAKVDFTPLNIPGDIFKSGTTV
jgi:hypothetical protein